MLRATDYRTMASQLLVPDVLAKFRALGWKNVPVERKYIQVFTYRNEESEFFQAIVPTDRILTDFDSAMLRAADTVARATKRGLESVLQEWANPVSDILRIRLNNPRFNNGCILFDDAVRLYNKTKALIKYAAMDAESPAASHGQRDISKVSKFLSRCRFGQTEIGSYVVSVVLPFRSDDTDQMFDNNDLYQNSLTRRTTHKLMESLDIVTNAGLTAEPIQNLTDCILKENKFSLEFLSTLGELTQFQSDSQITLDGIWDATVTSNRPLERSITLCRDQTEYIKEAFHFVMAKINKGVTGFMGYVRHLDANPNKEQRDGGVIEMQGVSSGGGVKCLKVELLNENYEQAIEAHKEGRGIIVSGDYIGRNRIKCTSFTLASH